jgi:hypothetical protein
MHVIAVGADGLCFAAPGLFVNIRFWPTVLFLNHGLLLRLLMDGEVGWCVTVAEGADGRRDRLVRQLGYGDAACC